MATYVNDLRLKEITTGDESGTWGTSTNTNLELIANAMGLGAEAIPNASTHTITMADGAADEFRSTFLRLTGGGQACTVTLGPSTLSHTWIMRNETAAALTLTQGSGANVVIAAGQTKIVSTDGGGVGAIVYEMDDLELAGNLIASAATITTLASSAATLTGGTVNGMVVGGSTPAAGTFTTLTANTSATVSGDLTVDTSTLKVDSTNNRVGILNASPDVVLDIGSSTDAVHMPVGTTGQRPTGAAGYFRYNSTLSQFEGYTDGWGAIGGGGGSNLVSNTMTGDGSTTTISLTNNPQDENNTQVYIDGVYQNKDTYSVSGTTLTFSTAPPLGTAVEVMTIEPTAINIPADGSVTPAKIASGDFYFDTNTLYVDATNNRVGIGTSSPSSQLEIDESGSGDATIKVGNAQNVQTTNVGKQGATAYGSTAAGAAFLYTYDNDISIMSDGGTGSIKFTTGGNTQKMVLDASGNVGIGTSSPVEKLYVNSTSGDARIGLNAPTGSDTEIKFSNNAVVEYTIGHDDGTDNFVIGGANVDLPLMSVTKAGKVNIGGVGNISPYGIRFAINGTGSGGAGLYFGSGVIIPTDNTPTITDANVDLGASNYRFKDLYLSGGAYLGGTAAANKLDHYEEVAWTPTQAGVTLSVTKARALRVGNLVTLNARISWPANNDSSQVAIGGLPFPAQTTWEGTSSIMAFNAVLDSSRPQLNAYMGGASINFYKTGSGVTWVSLTNASLSGAEVIFTLSYLAS